MGSAADSQLLIRYHNSQLRRKLLASGILCYIPGAATRSLLIAHHSNHGILTLTPSAGPKHPRSGQTTHHVPCLVVEVPQEAHVQLPAVPLLKQQQVQRHLPDTAKRSDSLVTSQHDGSRPGTRRLHGRDLCRWNLAATA